MGGQTKIIKLVSAGSRVTITLSDHDQPLIVSDETVLRHRLVDGIVITDSQLKQLRYESQLYLCDSEIARMLGLREHSIGELRGKLKRKQFAGDVVEETIAGYRRKGLLDDAQYAYRLSRRLTSERPCGRSYLIAYLQRKKIDRSLAEQTVQTVLSGTDETEQAVAALEKRWRQLGQFELEVARKKSYNYLARRGFSYEAAKRAFEKLVSQKQEDPEN